MTVPKFLEGGGTASGPTILAGFSVALHGTRFAFKSFHPLAEKGLILRVETGGNVVSWQTDDLRFNSDSPVARFVWIAGYANGTSEADREFTLLVNDAPWFHFEIQSRVEAATWSSPGPDGATLRFESRWKDWAGDEYGYMSLDVPRGVLPENRPLTLRLEGEEGESRDWFNVFTYPLAEQVEVVGHPALVRGAAGTRQLIGVFIDHVSAPSSVHMRTGSGEDLHGVAEFGYNVFTLEVEPVGRETKMPVTVTVGNTTLFEGTATLRPVPERVFYLLPHSHNDIGYSDHQETMLLKQFQNIENALALITKTAGYPPEARFKWNVEILWTVEQWLARASSEQREAFVRAVRGRQMGLDALFGNMLTGICRPEEHLRMTHYARRLGRELGVPLTSAMSGDIPGFIWGIVPALAQSGVRYFSSGPNFQPFLPDTGDRVGHSNRAWCDRPFYWRSPSGKEKVLFWMAGKGYSWFHDWILGRARHGLAHHFYRYMRELEESDYPYEIVQLRYTIGTDNGPTDPGLSDFVREWNARHITPRFVIATTAEMFEEFERRYGDSIPEHAGELTPYWEDGVLSTLRELGTVRNASQRLVQAETLAAMTGPAAADQQAADAAWRQITLFYEHTWGAYNSITDPDGDFARSQWNVKESFAIEADRRSRTLLQQVTARRPGEVLPDALDVINTCSWLRTDLLVVQPEHGAGVRGLRDEKGGAVRVQRLSTGEVAFLAEDIPPLGMKRFFFDDSVPVSVGETWADGRRMGNREVTVEVDPASGALRSVRDLVRGVELVDHQSGRGMNDFLYVQGLDPAKSVGCTRTSITVKESGPLVVILEVTSEAPGCSGLVRRIRLVHGNPRIEIENTLVRKRVRTKEAIHFAFPFHIPGGTIVLDGGWGVVRPGVDQLAGACKDFFYAQRWADVANKDFGCTLATVESPIVEIGSMTSEVRANNGYRLWRTEVDVSTTIFSYVMNNYWHTNYKADQEGPATVRYALVPHGERDLASCARQGIEVQQPLLLLPARGPVQRSMFTLSSMDRPGHVAGGVLVPWVDSSRDGRALMVRLFNASGQRERVGLRWGGFQPARVLESSPFEEEGKSVGNEIELDAWEFRTLRCAIPSMEHDDRSNLS
jgi:hypothetical protein